MDLSRSLLLIYGHDADEATAYNSGPELEAATDDRYWASTYMASATFSTTRPGEPKYRTYFTARCLTSLSPMQR
jgi:hypothetical protein